MSRYLITAEVWIEAASEELAEFAFHAKNLAGAEIVNIYDEDKGSDWL